MSIRLATESDLSAILRIYAPYVENTTYTFEYTAPTLPEFTARFRELSARFPFLVWQEDGRILGYAYGSLPFGREAYAWCGEVSIYLQADARGRGIGRQLYAALERLMQLQGYRVLYSIVTAENTPSLSFHRALGYREVGHFPDCGYKFGRWLGVTWLEKRLESVENPVCKPTAWVDFVKSDRNWLEFLNTIPLS